MMPASQDSTARRLNCERCGAAFTCDPGGQCWCMDETVRLPLPAAGEGGDCLCRDCLRAAADEAR